MTDPPGEGPLVSIVTPVYNGGPYLAECIDSIVAQTYASWNCTIVDNASSDSTPDIAEAYACRDSRIRHVRFDDFVDSTANHNRAFETIGDESEFCKVVQGDDWLFPNCLSRMVEAAQLSESVGVVSAYQLSGRRVHLNGLPYTTQLARGRDVLRSTLLGEFNVTGGPTATLLRSALVRSRRPFYQHGFRHEDSEAMLWMHTRSDLAFVHQVLTFAREQPGSQLSWSKRVGTAKPEEIVFLLRYGRDGLDEVEYRSNLRARLRDYVWWHVKQLRRLSRLREPDFVQFHWAKREQILAEANGDPEVRAAMTAVGALLLGRGSRPGGAALAYGGDG